jgi:hypothetical protein
MIQPCSSTWRVVASTRMNDPAGSGGASLYTGFILQLSAAS